MVRVHITLRSDLANVQEAADQVTVVAGLTDINEKRLARYGLLSGLMEQSRVDAVRAMTDLVDDVAVDGLKTIY